MDRLYIQTQFDSCSDIRYSVPLVCNCPVQLIKISSSNVVLISRSTSNAVMKQVA